MRKSESLQHDLEAVDQNLEPLVEQRQVPHLHAAKLTAIGRLSVSIAHEFSSPLQSVMTILKGFADLDLGDKDKALLELALQETSRMKDLIRSLQAFYRASPGQEKLFEMHDVIDSVLLLFASQRSKKRIVMTRHYDQRLPLIRGVPDQIKQVILILLENAVEACREGGRITVTTAREEENIAVAITDDGVGIDPARIDQIFQPFYTTKHTVKGAGQGLSVAYGIIRSHRGEVRVESRPEEGSRFTVVMPVDGRGGDAWRKGGSAGYSGLSA